MGHAVNHASCELLGGFFATLAHTTRMRIFCALQHEPMTVTEIALRADVSITNASQHLRLMRDRRAVIAEKHAQNVYYRIADPRFIQAAALIRDALSQNLLENVEGVPSRGPRKRARALLQPA